MTRAPPSIRLAGGMIDWSNRRSMCLTRASMRRQRRSKSLPSSVASSPWACAELGANHQCPSKLECRVNKVRGRTLPRTRTR